MIRPLEAIQHSDENGDPHCEDGPAVIHTNGDKGWFIHGKRHRIGGPAIEWNNGDESWYQYGVLHREDGPAWIWEGNEPKWWYKGKSIPVNNLQDFQSYIRNKAFW